MSKTLKRNVVSTIALMAALGVSAPAIAGNTDAAKPKMQNEATQTETMQKDPAMNTGDEASKTDASEAAQNETTPVDEQNTEMTETDKPVVERDETAEVQPGQKVAGQIVLQDADTILVSTLIGASVENNQGEVIGDINDILANRDGSVKGVVIGVGGFLGLGEKDVAIEFNRIELVDDEDTVRLTLDVSEEELENAPAFETAEARGTQVYEDEDAGDPMKKSPANQMKEMEDGEEPQHKEPVEQQ